MLHCEIQLLAQRQKRFGPLGRAGIRLASFRSKFRKIRLQHLPVGVLHLPQIQVQRRPAHERRERREVLEEVHVAGIG